MKSIHGNSGTSKAPIFLRGKRIGEIAGTTATFFVTPRHWFGAGNGFSLDQSIIERLEGNIDRIEFLDKRAKRRETIAYDAFMARAWLTKDYGFGRKFVCDSRFYDGRQPRPTVVSAPPSPVPQPTLFALTPAPMSLGMGTHG